MTVQEFLVNKIIGNYRRSLELHADNMEQKLRKKLENYSKIELRITRVEIELIAKILPETK